MIESLSPYDDRPVLLRSEPSVSYHELEIPGVILIQPKVRRDVRGFFVETWRQSEYKSCRVTFVQDNHSRSAAGVLRGMHFQPGQAKLVRCARGAILDVVVDLRKDSPTFRRWTSVALDDVAHLQLFVPDGCAHGFLAREESDVVYKVSEYYDPDKERGFRPDDPELAIAWTSSPRPIIMSDRDRNAPFLRDVV